MITLGEVGDQVQKIEFRCNRCPRSGTYNVARMAAHYGSTTDIGELMRTLSADCPMRQSTNSNYDVCGVHCPTLSRITRPRLRNAD